MTFNADKPGLRQRKKAKTRATIQKHALGLFRKQGYDATTVEQIAAAAEVSPSTFFRYFPAKEDVVTWDEFDPLIIAAFKSQPAGMNPIEALRNAMKSVFGSFGEKRITEQKERLALILSVPALKSRLLDQFFGLVQLVAGIFADRTGHDGNDVKVLNLAGALVGVMMAAMLTMDKNPDADFLALIDASLAHLEDGLPQ